MTNNQPTPTTPAGRAPRFTDFWSPKIHCKTNSVISGEHTEDLEYTDEMFDVPILKAFVDDTDITQITVVSTCVGFVKTFTKQFKAEGGDHDMTDQQATTPAGRAELARKLRIDADWMKSHIAAFISGDVEREAADILEAQAAELKKLKAIADAAGELDADNVRTMDGMPLGVVVPQFVIDKIQAAWLDWKGAEHD